MKIGNYYTGLDEYRVIFDSMSFFYDGPGLDELIKAPLLVVTLGSQTIFPSNDTPSLEWFETIVPSKLMPGIQFLGIFYSATGSRRRTWSHVQLDIRPDRDGDHPQRP